ncbi:MAG: RNA polymerase sigma-70 factor [Saprospiraceae bacterium]|nr:RNA polymerase sigma-70 factor [Saprospiraceae bacterium]MCB9318549.1 RNA polymerase sigma-70 factor [Lewinellaceae bacterium]
MEQSAYSGSDLLALIRASDPRALTWIYNRYYQDLVRVAFQITGDGDLAEDVVQESIVYFWDRREAIEITQSLFGYLKRMCVNRALRRVQQEQRRSEVLQFQDADHSESRPLEFEELQTSIHQAISTLPDRCEEVFRLSREDQLTYAEIADRMGISIKTVENQMSKALRLLREKLKDFLISIFL